MPRIDKSKLNDISNNKKKSSFADAFRKGFGKGKDRKVSKQRTQTTGQKIMGFFKGK